jgi:hypothetical protein
MKMVTGINNIKISANFHELALVVFGSSGYLFNCAEHENYGLQRIMKR